MRSNTYDAANRLISISAPAGTSTITYDLAGNMVSRTDANASTTYDAFGNATTTGATQNKFGYTGQSVSRVSHDVPAHIMRGARGHAMQGVPMDAITGLIYFKARHYDPELGRFISADAYEGEPATPVSWNSYLYANGDAEVEGLRHQPKSKKNSFARAQEQSAEQRKMDEAQEGAQRANEKIITEESRGIEVGGKSLEETERSPGQEQLKRAHEAGKKFAKTGEGALEALAPGPETVFGGAVIGATMKAAKAIGKAVAKPVAEALKRKKAGKLEKEAEKVEKRAAGNAIDDVGRSGHTRTSTDYSRIRDPKDVNATTKPTPRQVREMKEANRAQNKGVLRDDVTGEIMVDSAKSMRGVKPPKNEAQVDHINPVDNGGTRTQSNLNLRTRQNNREKSNKVIE